MAYGASQFTQDADLWVEPTSKNLGNLRIALAALHARPRFLPPLELRHLKRGHGIHFILPHGNELFYLDLLGKPPRVGSFAEAWLDATFLNWRGLRIAIIDLPRLVETKKTDRDQDYIAILRLAELVYRRACSSPKRRLAAINWLLAELRTPRCLKTVAQRWPEAKAALPNISRPAALLAARNAPLAVIQAAMDEEKSRYQQANRDYWKPLLKELRQIRQEIILSKRNSRRV